jgi:chitinase
MRYSALFGLFTLGLLACGSGTDDKGAGGGTASNSASSGSGGATSSATGSTASAGGASGTGGDATGVGGAGGAGGSGGAGGAGGSSAIERRVVGYYASWNVYDRQYLIKDIETTGSGAKLTHINYAFANLENGEATLGDKYADLDTEYTADKSVDGKGDTFEAGAVHGSLGQLSKLKAMHPELKALISIGGASWSGNFASVSATAAARKKFVDSAIDRFIRGNFAPGLSRPGVFDGIDVDWEYPKASQKQLLTDLLADFRAALDAEGQKQGKHYLLTIATPAGPQNIVNFDLKAVHPLLDFINVMTYDFHGSWDFTTNFHSALHGASGDPAAAQKLSIDNIMKIYTDATVPANKLVVGLPFYGRGWSGVEPGPKGDGLFQAASGPAPGKFEAGLEDYEILKGLEGTFKKYTHPEAKVPYLYNPQTKIWWSYDDAASITEKMAYVKANNLGGAMFWELSGDDKTGTLISAIAAGLAD